MKKIILIGLVFVIAGCATTKMPMGPSKKMMTDADIIILKVNQTPEKAFNSLKNYLLKKQFQIASKYDSLHTLKTTFHKFAHSSKQVYPISIFARVSHKDSTIIKFHAKARWGIGNPFEVKNHGNGVAIGSMKKTWKMFNKIVSGYPNVEILYERS